MITYILNIETRKNDRDEIIGPFSSFEKAQAALRAYLSYWTEDELKSYDEYDSDYSKGKIYTEEFSAEILEREME